VRTPAEAARLLERAGQGGQEVRESIAATSANAAVPCHA
jgi:hypothetical protein